MAAEAMGALQAGLDRMMEGLERRRLRPMQKQGYLCCAECCDSAGPSPQALQACMLRCTEPATRAEQATSAAVGEMQNRLTRYQSPPLALLPPFLPCGCLDFFLMELCVLFHILMHK